MDFTIRALLQQVLSKIGTEGFAGIDDLPPARRQHIAMKSSRAKFMPAPR